MRLYFVRHGESELNAMDVHQHPTVALSKKGMRQAKQVAKRFNNISIDVIISSDLMRARQTAKEIAHTTGKEIIFTSLLRERRRPSQLHGKKYGSDEVIEVVKLINAHGHDPNWHHSDEENFFDARSRAKEFLFFLEKRTEKNIAVVSHGAFLKYLMVYMLFGEESNAEQFEKIFHFFETDNTGITVFEKKMDRYYRKKIVWYLAAWNDRAHLGES